MRSRQKIIFIFGRGGGGHKAAAHAVQAGFDGGNADIEFMDAGYTIEAIMHGNPTPRVSGFDVDELYNTLMRASWFTTAAWLGLVGGAFAKMCRPKIVKGLAAKWQAEQPKVVVSFIPFFNRAFREALHIANPHATFVTVVTDFASSAEHYWYTAAHSLLTARAVPLPLNADGSLL